MRNIAIKTLDFLAARIEFAAEKLNAFAERVERDTQKSEPSPPPVPQTDPKQVAYMLLKRDNTAMPTRDLAELKRLGHSQ